MIGVNGAMEEESVEKKSRGRPKKVLVDMAEVKKRQKAEAKASVKPDESFSPFEDPEAALDAGSAQGLAVIEANKVSAPIEHEISFSDEEISDAKKLDGEIERLVFAADDISWDLGEKYYQMIKSSSFRQLGFSSFEEYIEDKQKAHNAKDLTALQRRRMHLFSYRKAMYLAKIHEYFYYTLKQVCSNKPHVYKEFKSLADSREIPWTYARAFASANPITEISTDEQDEVAKEILTTKTEKEIVKIFKERKAEIEGALDPGQLIDHEENNKIKTVPMRFQLYQAQQTDVENALELATGMLKDSPSKKAVKSNALAFICRDFLSTNVVATGGKIDVNELFRRYEQLFRLTMIVIDEDSGEIIHGKDVLSRYNDPSKA